MISYYIYMDQGLIVDLRNYTLCSGQFSSCAPIVFYNANNHYGGLYHLGGCDQLDEMKTHHLMVIASVVRPTDVYVLVGGGEMNFMTARHDYHTGHVAPVRALFPDSNVHDNFNGRSIYMSITVTEVAGALRIAPEHSFDNKLNTAAKIDALPDDVGFIGEKSDRALSLWL